MGDNGRVVSVRLTDQALSDLNRVVALEQAHARPGHHVTRSDLARVAVEMFVAQRLRRAGVSRETIGDTNADTLRNQQTTT